MSQVIAQGASGTVAFAAKMPGRILPNAVDAGRDFVVSRHGFLAANPDVTLELGI